VVALPVEFDRDTEKTLTVSDVSVASLYGDELASGNMTENGAKLSLKNLSDLNAVYGILTDQTGETVAYTKVAQLEGPADYTKVDAALSRVPKDLNVYTDESVQALKDTIAAVDRNKKASQHAEVDQMAADIETAIENLQKKPESGLDQPNTGDENAVPLFVTLSLAAGAALLGAVLYKKKRDALK